MFNPASSLPPFHREHASLSAKIFKLTRQISCVGCVSHCSHHQRDVCVVYLGRQHEGAGNCWMWLFDSSDALPYIVHASSAAATRKRVTRHIVSLAQRVQPMRRPVLAPALRRDCFVTLRPVSMQKVHSVVCGEMMPAAIDLQVSRSSSSLSLLFACHALSRAVCSPGV